MEASRGRQIKSVLIPIVWFSVPTPKESFAPGVKRTYGLMELVRGTCPTVDKGPYNFVFTWPHLLRAEMVAFLLIARLSLRTFIYQCPA